LKRLHERKYAEILCYPRYEKRETINRIQELKKLGIEALEFRGDKKAFNVPVLGKGYVGIVIVACIGRRKVALKIQRVDAESKRLKHEAEMLQKANDIDIGPCLIASSENFLVMELLDGILLPKWIETLKGRGTKNKIRMVLRGILEQCWKLDDAGLDHGELSNASKHIIVSSDYKVDIVDFETASIKRKVSNLTSISQYLFIGSKTAKIMGRKLGKIDEETLIVALRNYKQKRSIENFNNILEIGNLIKH
jgi:putative serine/threonine protein kinase